MAPSDSNEICDWGPVFEQHQRWLYRIALRKIVNHHRASGRRRKLLQSAFELEASVRAEDSMTPFSWLLKTEAQTSVQQGLEKLQRIVDVELSHSRRAEQLKSLEPHSLQWRELALLLLEDQELSKQIRSEPPIDTLSRASDSLSASPRCVVTANLESDALATAVSRKLSLGYRLLAVCAIFSVGLGSGFLFKAIAPDAASFPQALSGVKRGLPKDFAGDSTEVRLADSISSSGGSFDYGSNPQGIAQTLWSLTQTLGAIGIFHLLF